MDIISVFEHFKVLAGLDNDEDSSKYLPLCAVSLASISAKLIPYIDTTSSQMLIAAAAAADAYYNYVLSSAAKEGDASFAAGDVKVNKSFAPAINAAKTIRDDRLSAIAHLCTDNFFDFKVIEEL